MNIRTLLLPEVRVSMMQTSLNVSASNFHGKNVSSKKILDYAFEVYRGMLKQLSASERNEVLVPTPKKPKAKRGQQKSMDDLLAKVSKKKLTKKGKKK